MAEAETMSRPRAMSSDTPLEIDLSGRSAEQQALEDKVRSWLDQPCRVHIVDGRVIRGKFFCLDYSGNVLLRDGSQIDVTKHPLESGHVIRRLGQVLIAGKHILKIDLKMKEAPDDDVGLLVHI